MNKAIEIVKRHRNDYNGSQIDPIVKELENHNTRATDPLLEEMASYIKMIINLYDFKENDLWMEDGGKLLKKYMEATCQVEKK